MSCDGFRCGVCAETSTQQTHVDFFRELEMTAAPGKVMKYGTAGKFLRRGMHVTD